jgi:hypothetical protein
MWTLCNIDFHMLLLGVKRHLKRGRLSATLMMHDSPQKKLMGVVMVIGPGNPISISSALNDLGGDATV